MFHESTLFEALTLGVFEAQLVSRIRQAGRVPHGIPGFDVRRVPAMTELAVDESTPKRAPWSIADLPTSTPQADALAEEVSPLFNKQSRAVSC